MESSTALIVRSDGMAPAPASPAGRPASRHPAVVYITRLGPGSRRAMRGALEQIAVLLSNGREDSLALDWSALRYPHVQAVRAVLAERYAPATANRMMAALRGCLKECRRLELMPAEAYATAVDVEPVRGSTLPAGRGLSQAELRALLEACRRDLKPQGRRDAALIAVLYGGGLRRSELAALAVDDVMLQGELRIRCGKGHKARTVYLGDGAQRALDAWMVVRGTAPGPLFLAINKGGCILGTPLCGQAVERILRKRGVGAGVAPFVPHDLRRSFISDLIDNGADLVAVQQLAGHANVQTTARYDRRGERAKQRAAGLLHVPFVA
jgi:site-specific recombinase XerD